MLLKQLGKLFLIGYCSYITETITSLGHLFFDFIYVSVLPILQNFL